MSSYKSVTLGAATISHGNGKIGNTPNVSLLPVVSCPRGVPCARSGECYDQKACRLYPTVKAARTRNWKAASKRRAEYFAGIRQYLQRYSPKYFRWHVGGDIPDAGYYREMCRIAREFPNTKFMAFTKNHGLDFRGRPANLAIVFSMWPRWGDSKKRMPRAWMQDGTETRIPADAVECSGQCDHCGVCWNLKPGQNVFFHKH